MAFVKQLLVSMGLVLLLEQEAVQLVSSVTTITYAKTLLMLVIHVSLVFLDNVD